MVLKRRNLERNLLHLGGARLAETSTLGVLLEELEGTLLGDVAELAQLLDSLLTRGVLLAADDASALGLHQILLDETTGSVLGGAVEDSSLGAHGGQLGATLLLALCLAALAILTGGNVATSICHLFYLGRTYFAWSGVDCIFNCQNFYIDNLGTSPFSILSISSAISSAL